MIDLLTVEKEFISQHIRKGGVAAESCKFMRSDLRPGLPSKRKKVLFIYVR